MRRRPLLLGVLLVAVAVMASGCAGSILPPIIVNPDVNAVNAVVNAFMDALENQDDEQMEELLASSVSSAHEMGWLGIRTGTLTRGEFASDWTNLWVGGNIDIGIAEGVVPKFSVVGLRFTQGPSVAVTGSTAKATGKVLLALGHPDNWYSEFKLDIEPICLVEDTYPVELQLQKIGSSWLVTGFSVEIGERQSAISDVWETFVEGLQDEDDVKVLSVCQNPFLWTGWDFEGLIPVGVPYEWRLALEGLFTQAGPEQPLQIDLIDVVPMTLDAWSGALRGHFTWGLGTFIDEYLAEITFGWHGDRWLMESIHVIRPFDI